MKTNSLKTTTRTFKSGNSIAVRIPRQFNVEAGKTLEIRRRGNELVLVEHSESLAGLIDVLQSFPADFFAEGRHDPPPQERDFSGVFDLPAKPLRKPTSGKSTARKKTTKARG